MSPKEPESQSGCLRALNTLLVLANPVKVITEQAVLCRHCNTPEGHSDVGP